ncbi:hypothetical protein GCM10027517_04740 [Phycicoccus ginsengisoli]
MPTVTVGHENDHDIDLYYEDHGSGQPVVGRSSSPSLGEHAPSTP